MGKHKKDRKHAASGRAAADPTGLAALQAQLNAHEATQTGSVGSLSSAEHAQQNQQLLDKLSGSDVQKSVACSGLAHIIANQLRPATSVITPQLLKKLLPLLLERNSYDVAISAAGAFRNISSLASGLDSSAGGKSHPILQLLLNSDACTVAINLLESEKTEWILSVPVHQHAAASSSSSSSSSSAAASSITGLQPTTPIERRFHFLTQIISGLANLSEQFDVVLGYLLSNSLAFQHLLLLLLDPTTHLGAAANTFHGLTLQVEISNLLLLISEGNEEFARACARLPAGFGGVNGIVQKLLMRLEPSSPAYAASPQVRAHLAGILLNLQSPQVLLSLSSQASASLPLPGVQSPVPVSGEQLCITSILSTLNSLLDLDPLQLGSELVAKLREDRVGVDQQLSRIEAEHDKETEHHRQMATARHQAKLARKAKEAAAAVAVANGATAADAEMEMDGGAAGEETKEAEVEEESKIDTDASSAAAPASATDDSTMFADEHDEMESTHNDARAAAKTSVGGKSPEAMISSQWAQHLEENLAKYRQYLLAIRIALELLTNLCSASEEELDQSDSDSDSGHPSQLDANHLGYIPKMVLHLGILPKIVKKCHLHLNPDLIKTETTDAATASSATVDPSSPAALHGALCSIFTEEEVASRIVELMDDIRNRCINALNNIVLYLPREVLPGAELSSLFTYSCTLIQQLAVPYTKNVPLAIDEIGNLTSLLLQLASKDTKQVPCNKDVIMMLVQLGRAENVNVGSSSSSADASSAALSKRKVQLHVIGILSLIGTKPESFPYNFVIGSVLLDVIKHAGMVISQAQSSNNPSVLHYNPANDETHFLECASESLNAIIDIYSEDDRHVDTQKSIGMVQVMDQFLPLFQSGIKVLQQQKAPKVPKQFITRLQDNALNAKEFVKYKKANL